MVTASIVATALIWTYWPVPKSLLTVTEQASATSPRVVVPFAIGGAITRSASEELVLSLPANTDDVQITAGLERESHPPFQGEERGGDG